MQEPRGQGGLCNKVGGQEIIFFKFYLLIRKLDHVRDNPRWFAGLYEQARTIGDETNYPKSVQTLHRVTVRTTSTVTFYFRRVLIQK